MALSPLDLVLSSLKELSSNWVRAGLTSLGIFMGVAAVNVTFNIDAISSEFIQQKLEERDNPFLNLWVYDPNKTEPSPELSDEILAQMEREILGILDISWISWIDGSSLQHQGTAIENFESLGVSENYQSTTGRKILRGRFFDSLDFRDYRPVAIIDEILVEQLFDGKDPIGEAIFFDGVRLVVVGVSESKNNQSYQQPVGTLWVPDTYGYLLQGKLSLGSPQIALRHLEEYEKVRQNIQELIVSHYPGFDVYFMSNAEDLYKEDRQQRISSNLLKFVSLIALIIGGVGISNITVATVVGRTREIGLRRALGATDFEVMSQFILEATILSLIAGGAAILSVHFATKTLTTELFEAPYRFRTEDAAIAMGAALLVGVGSSFLPALRTVQIDVVQALRGE